MIRWLQPNIMASRVSEIGCYELIEKGIHGVILDLDNTLLEWRNDVVPTDVEEWVRRLKQTGISVCIVSNSGRKCRIQPISKSLEVPWICRAKKPLPRGFREGMRQLGTSCEDTAVVGDQLFTDILGGNVLGLFTILVRPMSSDEALPSRLQRPLERLMGRLDDQSAR